MPIAIRATINKGLGSLGRQWQADVARAKAWLDEHPYYVPGVRTSGQLDLYLDDKADDFAAFERDNILASPRGCLP